MNAKTIVGGIVVVIFIVFGTYSFVDSNVEYTNVAGAIKSHKKVQLKGTWNKDKESYFDSKTSQFTFYLMDEHGQECKVILDGAAPNNFELATSVVAKGRFKSDEGCFHAEEVLTKCPSKYEAKAEQVKKNT